MTIGAAPTTRHRRTAAIPAEDATLVAVLDLEFPMALAFTGRRKEPSNARFKTWTEQLRTRADAATTHYEPLLHDPAPTVRAAAAEMVFAEIPAELRTGELAAEEPTRIARR